MNNAYITLLSSLNYIEAVLALSKNFQIVKSQYPLVVMITEDIFDLAIPFFEDLNNTIPCRIPFLHYNATTEQEAPDDYIPRIASKLACFLFKDYDKMVYLDADCVILHNIDDLFNYPDGAMYEDMEDAEQGFAGLFVFCPQNHNLKYYMSVLQLNNIWESDLLETLWFPFKTNSDYRIPFKYFENITNCNFENDTDFSITKAIHFCYYDKPWKFKTEEEFLQSFSNRIGCDLNTSIKLKTIISYYWKTFIIPLRQKYGEILLGYSLGDR